MRIPLFAALVVAPTCLAAQSPAPATAPNAVAPFSTATTPIGTLLDDANARAVLDKDVPGFTSNDQIELARARTLKQIQPFVSDVLTDEVLAKIDADLAKLTVKP